MRKQVVNNPRYPHYIRIIRKVVSDWMDDHQSEEDFVVYAGPGRSYTDTTTTGDAKVDTNKRKCSIPVRFDAWGTDVQGNQLVPMSGDMVYVAKCNIHEEWEVKDFEPDNDRSVVYGEHNRNLNEG
jgi:hypothetical protein